MLFVLSLLVRVLAMWVPENRSRVLSCEFVEEAGGRDARCMTPRLLYLLFCQVMRSIDDLQWPPSTDALSITAPVACCG